MTVRDNDGDHCDLVRLGMYRRGTDHWGNGHAPTMAVSCGAKALPARGSAFGLPATVAGLVKSRSSLSLPVLSWTLKGLNIEARWQRWSGHRWDHRQRILPHNRMVLVERLGDPYWCRKGHCGTSRLTPPRQARVTTC